MEQKCCLVFNSDLSENVSYANPLFPAYVSGGLMSYFPDFTFASHWHDDLEFNILLSGKVTYNVNGRLVTISKGEGIFVNSRQLHSGFSPNKKESEFYSILLHPSFICANLYFAENFIEPFLRDPAIPFIVLKSGVAWSGEILKLLKEIFSNANNEFSPFIIQRNFFRIMELLYANNRPAPLVKEKLNSKLNTVKKMISFVQENYAKNISLEEIAESGASCKSKCSELFRQYIKDSPMVFLNKYRLQKSCVLLKESDLAITQIALDCGYNGSSYFCEIFRKYYGLSPQEYRKS